MIYYALPKISICYTIFGYLKHFMEKFQLKSEKRELNSRNAKPVFRAGNIPAELYGHNIDNIHVAVNAIEFEKVLRKAGESTIIELVMPEGGNKNVLIQDVQYHYLNGQPIHVDFFEVSMTEKLTATVAIEFVGEADAVRVLGGTLVKVLTEVEVECLPADLPQYFEIDISKLATFSDVIEVKDIPVSDKVKILAEPDELVVKVQQPRDMEAELAPEVDEAAAVAAAVGPEPDAEGAETPTEDKKAE